MKTTRTTAVDISISCKLNRPTSVPSVTPIPPGKNETAPKINDDVYVMTLYKTQIAYSYA